MGITDRREREKVQRKNAIIDAAEKFFFSKGIGNTTLDEIAEEVEISKATIYLYFKSKEELYVAIIQRAMDIIKNMMKDAAAEGENGLYRLYKIGNAFYEYFKQYPDYFTVLFSRESMNFTQTKDNPQMEDLLMQGEEMFELAVNVIKDGIKDGSIRPDVDPYKAALSLDGIFTGLLRVVSLEEDHLMKYHNVSPEELVRYSLDLIGHALISDNLKEAKKCAPCELPQGAPKKIQKAKNTKKKKENNR